jgi:hypothetical protein
LSFISISFVSHSRSVSLFTHSPTPFVSIPPHKRPKTTSSSLSSRHITHHLLRCVWPKAESPGLLLRLRPRTAAFPPPEWPLRRSCLIVIDLIPLTIWCTPLNLPYCIWSSLEATPNLLIDFGSAVTSPLS